jgi:hypothetical protein
MNTARSFLHVNSRINRVLIESYCLVCHKFIAASWSVPNLFLTESAHRSACKEKIEKAHPPDTS